MGDSSGRFTATMLRVACCAACVTALVIPLHGQSVGAQLSPWSEGTLDIHRISTGQADAVLFIFPDRTTMLMDPGHPWLNDPKSPRFTQPRPDATRAPGERVARYVRHFLPEVAATGIDYGLITHFHGDHMGGFFDGSHPGKGDYKLTGITDVGHRLHIHTMIDRAWPDYPTFPPPSDKRMERDIEQQRSMMANYRKFLEWQIAHNGMRVERFQPGGNRQIALKRAPEKFRNFEVRNISASGRIWTGEDNESRQFLPLDEVPPSELATHENKCSIVFRLRYGAFDYYAGGDIPGDAPAGKPYWFDVETPVAKAVGPVDVAVLNHHAVRDTTNETFLKTLQPRVCVVSYWSVTHLDRKVLERVLSEEIYPGPRDVFSTNVVELHHGLDPNIARLKSQHGHIVIRVSPGGADYKVITLDDTTESYAITAVHGPYRSR
jgi:beta-lactamase superfamily II metal-dependent hydrolase